MIAPVWHRTLIFFAALLAASIVWAAPIKTEIRKQDGRFRLYRGGQPYHINGVVYGGDRDGLFPLKDLAAHGANSIRTGNPAVLDEAHRLGLSVLMNLRMGMEKVHNFDYSDEEAVREQFEGIKKRILEVKDHPAILAWAIGNELTVNGYTNKRVWDAVSDIVRFIHEVDPNHPTLTTIGDGSIRRHDLIDIQKLAPGLDMMGINYYGGIEAVPALIRRDNWDKPYVLTEWGPSGWWQTPRTEWDAAIEQTSTEKAQRYLERYQRVVKRDADLCLGSYAFYWTVLHERTQTWFSMHLPTGERTGAVNVMEYLWTGEWPANTAPQVEQLRIDGRLPTQSVYLEPGSVHQAEVRSLDPDLDTLTHRWEVIAEVARGLGYAGMGEKHLPPIPGLIEKSDGSNAAFRAPTEEGAYRLFVYVTDGHGNAATANIPFYVRQ